MTYSSALDDVRDFIQVLGRNPVLSDVEITVDVNVEHVEVMEDGLHLAHFAQPHHHVVRSVHQQSPDLVLRVQQNLTNSKKVSKQRCVLEDKSSLASRILEDRCCGLGLGLGNQVLDLANQVLDLGNQVLGLGSQVLWPWPQALGLGGLALKIFCFKLLSTLW